MTDPVDDFELEVFTRTSDVDLAAKAGEMVRYAVDVSVQAAAAVLGVPAEAIPTEHLTAWILRPAEPKEQP